MCVLASMTCLRVFDSIDLGSLCFKSHNPEPYPFGTPASRGRKQVRCCSAAASGLFRIDSCDGGSHDVTLRYWYFFQRKIVNNTEEASTLFLFLTADAVAAPCTLLLRAALLRQHLKGVLTLEGVSDPKGTLVQSAITTCAGAFRNGYCLIRQ